MRGVSLLGTAVTICSIGGWSGSGIAGQEVAPRHVLARAGEATSCLILPDTAPQSLEKLCRQWIARAKQSTGAEIPLYRESNTPGALPGVVRIYIGMTQSAIDAGLSLESLPEDSYQVVHRKGAMYVLGSEERSPLSVQAPSMPLRWALNRIQEEGLGVRFLWPGDLGTWVPRQQSFEIAAKDISYRPPLALRVLRMSNCALTMNDPARLREYEEGIEWAQNHMAGRREQFVFGHAFIHWWKKYGKEHPDLFARPPEGVEIPVAGTKPEFVKLRLSNPKTVEMIAREYEEAGAPKYWNICPNDGSGFDLSPATLEWDEPKGQALKDIWEGNDRANLTARYVHFWNLVHERLRKLNPEVTLVTYAYWSYRHAPPAEHRLSGKTIVGVVDGWDAYETWKGWRKAGAELSLRPNWGYYSAGAPTVWVEEIVSFMRFAHRNGMIGFDLDQIAGHWATEGLNYYVMARMMSHPELSADQVIEEYCAAFGEAAPKIRDYFHYWQQRGKEFGYPIPAGGTTGPNPGKYRELMEQGLISDNYFHGPYVALPYLYTDEVLAPAFALLEDARSQVSPDSEAFLRVEFLRAGLVHHRLMRNAVALGFKVKAGEIDPNVIRDFRTAAAELDRFRKRDTFSHLVWPCIPLIENRFKAPIRPENVKAKMVDTITVQ